MSGKFGTSMFGFKRRRVIDYIEQQSVEHDAEMSIIIQDLIETKKALTLANAENQRLTEGFKACEQQLSDLRDLANQLKQKVESNSQLHEKIGDVFVEAKHSASRIIESATENAHTIVNSANNCATNTLENIVATKSRLNCIRSELQTMLNDFDQKLDSIGLSLERAKSNIKPTGFTVNTDITEDDLIGGSIIETK